MIRTQTPFSWQEENGEAFATFTANVQKIKIAVTWDSTTVKPTSYALLEGRCNSFLTVDSGQVFLSDGSHLNFTFSNLRIGNEYYLKFEGPAGSGFSLGGNLIELLTTNPANCPPIGTCNSIPNSGFETPDLAFPLPVGGEFNAGSPVAFVDEACGWDIASSHPDVTPDYYLAPRSTNYPGTCTPSGNGNTCTPFGNNSNGVAQLFTIDIDPTATPVDRREYIYTELHNFVQATGQAVYALSVNARHNTARTARCGALQVNFTNNFTPVSHNQVITTLGTPEVDFTNQISLTDPNWQNLTAIFQNTNLTSNTAMVVGNFYDNTQTANHLNANNPVSRADHIPALYLDDFVLEELPNAGNDHVLCTPGTVSLGTFIPCAPLTQALTTIWFDATGNNLGNTVPLTVNVANAGISTYRLQIEYGNQTFDDFVDVIVAPDLDATPLAADNCAKDAVFEIPNAADWISWSFTSPNSSVTWASAPKLDLVTNTLQFLNPQVTSHTGIGLVNGTVTFSFNGIICTQNVTLQINDCCSGQLQNYVILPDGANMSTFLPNTFMSNTNFTVYGTVTIDANYTFDNCEFYLMPDAALEVAGGVDVTFERSNLQACGDYKWDRILHDQPTSTLTLIECRLSDALRGIHSLNNAALLLSRNFFEANAFCQIIENYALNVMNWDANEYLIRESSYQTSQHPNSGVNLAPYIGIYSPLNGFGIDVIASTGLELTGGNTFWSNTIDNNLQLWIEFSSNVLVENNTFYEGLNIRVDGASTLEAYDNTFEILNTMSGYNPTGIRAYNSTLFIGQGTQPGTYSNVLLDGAAIASYDPVRTEIINNQIESYTAGYCIDIEHSNPIQVSSQTKIQHNELKGRWGMRLVNLNTDWQTQPGPRVLINFNAIFARRLSNLNSNSTKAAGISATNCEGISIGENTIVLENALGVSPPDANNYHLTVGIELADCRNPFIGCNCINFAGIGLELSGDVNKDIWNTLANGFALNFQANEFGSCYYGMYLNPQTTMPSAIGESGLAADNTWTNGCYFGPPMTTVERIKDDRNTQHQSTITYFRSNNNPNTNPNPASGFILVNNFGLANNCTLAPPPSNKKENEDDMERKPSQLNVFPNPAKDILSLDLQTHSLRGSYQLSVYNYVGQIVHSAEYLDHRIELPIEELPAGVYIVKVESQGKEIVSRFIKN